MNDASLPLLYQRDGHIARIHFNRPRALNAIDAATAASFNAACKVIAQDVGIRVVVLSAEGRAFVAGGDINSFVKNPGGIVDELIQPMHEGVTQLAGIQAPVIASLHGPVAGAGFSLAMMCDLAIAAEDTRFNLAYLNVGVTSDLGASWTLPRIVGLRKAMEIALLNETIDASEALRVGLVNRVVSVEALDAETEALAQRIASGPPVATGNMKRLLRESFDRELGQQLAAEEDSFGKCAATEDFAEAVSAFREKRPGVYRGR